MGAGKTTTARRLAKLLALPALDLDSEIELLHGPIGALFAAAGESSFRDIESRVLAQVLSAGPAVVALGGGAVIKEDNRKMIREYGAIVHLEVSAESALARVAHRVHRPMLGAVPSLERIQALLDERAAAYADHDFRVRVDGKTSLSVAHIIARWYRKRYRVVK